jgi:hypothetical protein
MSNVTTQKASYTNANRLKQSFVAGTTGDIGYVYIGNHIAYTNESVPDSVSDTIFDEKEIWDNMYAAKRVTSNDVELVIPRVNWTSNTKYRAYDDEIVFEELVSSNVSQNLKPMYVFTSDRNVYKCLSNNASVNSTVEPTGDYSTSNGIISTSDGYLWKYMYNVKPSNKFVGVDWIPAPKNTNQLDYSVNSTGVVDGEIASIIVTNSGSNYYNNNVTVGSFQTGCTVLLLSNTSNISANMSVLGLGLLVGTHITNIDSPNSKITISTPASSNGGGIGNTLFVSTRVYIEGDGTLAAASASMANGNVNKITVTTIGSNYSYANVLVFGSGTGATARAILPPKYGHAYNPAKELGAGNLMIDMKIGEIDSTENGLISANTSFREYGLLLNPHKYGSNSAITSALANSVISQTTNLVLVAGANYFVDEYVYQGSANNSFAYGFLNSQTLNQIKLTKVRGTFQVGLPIIGANSGVSRIVVSKTNPELEPYSGDVIYTEKILKVDREDGQSEDIKIVVKF